MKADVEVIGILYLYIILLLGSVVASVNFLLALVSNVWAFSSSQCQDQCFSQSTKATNRWQHLRGSQVRTLPLSCLHNFDVYVLIMFSEEHSEYKNFAFNL